MSETPNLPALPSDSLRPIGSSRPARGPEPTAASPAFEVMLERLTARAAELEEKSRALAAPEDLPEAMDAARASLEDALHLGAELLEAFRAAQHGPESGS
jgi:hypothetical protein